MEDIIKKKRVAWNKGIHRTEEQKAKQKEKSDFVTYDLDLYEKMLNSKE